MKYNRINQGPVKLYQQRNLKNTKIYFNHSLRLCVLCEKYFGGEERCENLKESLAEYTESQSG
jgi:hypothetical protein